MVFPSKPASCATSTKLTPSGVPSIGDFGPGGGGAAFASKLRSCGPSFGVCAAGCCRGEAIATISANGSTKAVRLSD